MLFLPFLHRTMIVGRQVDRKGAAMVELALSLMILMLIVFGITEFGRVMYTKLLLNNAAREGARMAVVTDPIHAYSAAVVAAQKIYPNGHLTMSPESPTTTGQPITVTVSVLFQSVVPNLDPSFAKLNITLRGETTMRYEYVP